MQLTLSKRFAERLQGRFEKYQLEAGVLQDGPHRVALRGERGKKGQDVLSSYAGGPVRKASRKAGPLTIAQVSAANRERMSANYLTDPFRNPASSEIVKFSQAFFKSAFGRGSIKRLENLLQAIIRNPILRGDYGGNSGLTQRIKGFNRRMIDTGQLFKAIRASVKVRGGRV